MRKRVLVVVAVLAAAGLVVLSLWPRDPGGLALERAIAAHGGSAAAAKCNIGQVKGHGTKTEHHFAEIALSWEETFHLPNRLKWVIRQKVDGQEGTTVILAKDGKYQMREENGSVRERPTREGDLIPSSAAVVIMLVNLRNEFAQLTPLAETFVDGKPALGFKVVAGEEWKGNLYFDKATGLLVQSKREDMSTIYRNYQEHDGVKLPMNVVAYRNNEKVSEMVVSHVQFMESIDERVFDDLK